MSVRRTSSALLTGAVLVGLVASPGVAQALPDQALPFACGEGWTGTTRAHHSPSPLAIDFNRTGDLGRFVLASAPGVVARVGDHGDRSYGKWVELDHGEGHSTVYAHLKVQWPVVGQYVDQGAPIGRVGDTGQASSAHLHYEQRFGKDVVEPWFEGTRFAFGVTQASANCPDVPLAGDWNGDRAAEVAVFRRDAGRGTFEMYSPDVPVPPVRLGRGFDLPVAGDWDGDGVTDVGVRRQAPRLFLLRHGDGTKSRIRVGMVRDLPVTGDWDGDGVTNVGVWRPRVARFRLVHGDGSHSVVPLGAPGSIPVTGDWDGDRVTDLGVYDPATSTFRLRIAPRGGSVRHVSTVLGGRGDLPVTGDWDGNGVTDIGVWTPTTATYTLRVAPVDATARTPMDAELRTIAFGRPR